MIREHRLTLAALVADARARLRTLDALYRQLGLEAQPASIRPALLDLAGSTASRREVLDGLARQLPPLPDEARAMDARGPGAPLSLRGEGLAAAYLGERDLAEALREALAVAGASPGSEALAGAARETSGRLRELIGLYRQYS